MYSHSIGVQTKVNTSIFTVALLLLSKYKVATANAVLSITIDCLFVRIVLAYITVRNVSMVAINRMTYERLKREVASTPL